MDLIAFNGGMGCGKSTAIEALREAMLAAGDTRKITLVKFAAPLYDIQEYVYKRIESVYKRPPNFIKDRKLLQWVGTDWGRSLDVNLWADIWQAEVKAAIARGELAVCDDVRFDNEAVLVKSLGGVIVKVSRNNGADHAHGGKGIANHASEAGIKPDYVDYIVENNSSLEDYKSALAYLYRRGLSIVSDSTTEHASV